jgi:hypothetical protein
MVKKPKEIQQVHPAAHLQPLEIERLISGDSAVHLTIASLLAGKPWATTRFPGYSMYLTKLRLAYDKADAEEFLRLLSCYFVDAYRSAPYMPIPQRTETAYKQLGRLVERYGVRQVGKCILARMLG